MTTTEQMPWQPKVLWLDMQQLNKLRYLEQTSLNLWLLINIFSQGHDSKLWTFRALGLNLKVVCSDRKLRQDRIFLEKLNKYLWVCISFLSCVELWRGTTNTAAPGGWAKYCHRQAVPEHSHLLWGGGWILQGLWVLLQVVPTMCQPLWPATPQVSTPCQDPQGAHVSQDCHGKGKPYPRIPIVNMMQELIYYSLSWYVYEVIICYNRLIMIYY